MNDVARPAPDEHRTLVNGVALAWFEWPAPAAAETVLLVHATGFHARCWDRVVAQLGGAHVIAVDMRGHGRSGKTGPFGWDTFGQDLADFAAALDLERVVGVGHSMGGHSLTQAAALHPQRFRRLTLIDPVILEPEMYAARDSEGGAPSDHPTARRRNDWASWRAMFERFRDRAPFSNWQPEVLEDYCRHGLLPAAEGDRYVLACPPEIEASIYMGSAGRDIYAMVAQVAIPVTVLRAKARGADRDTMDFSTSPTWPGLAGRFSQGRDVYLPEHSHFLPMEVPKLVADYVLDER